MGSELIEDFWQLLESHDFLVTDSRRWPNTAPHDVPSLDKLLMLLQSKIPPEYSKNVRMVLKDRTSGLLYVLSSEDKHFWGVSRGVISQLVEHAREAPWALILLDGSAQTGHWFDSTAVGELIQRRRWRERPGPRLGEELYYYVGPRREDTSEGRRFLGTDKLLKLLKSFLETSDHSSPLQNRTPTS